MYYFYNLVIFIKGSRSIHIPGPSCTNSKLRKPPVYKARQSRFIAATCLICVWGGVVIIHYLEGDNDSWGGRSQMKRMQYNKSTLHDLKT